MDERRTIVLAKAERQNVGRHAYKLMAVVWLNEGTAADFRNAEAYAKTEGYRVFSFPTDEPEPLLRAKYSVIPADMHLFDVPDDVIAYAEGKRPQPKENEGFAEYIDRAEFETAVFFS